MFHSPAERTCRYTFVTRYLWVVFAVVFGFTLWLLAESGISREMIISVFAIGIAAHAIVVYALITPKLQIHQEGIFLQEGLGAKELRWEEIRETKYRRRMRAQELGGAFGEIGMIIGMLASQKKNAKASSEWLIVIGDAGKLTISTRFANGAEVIQQVLQKVNPRLKAVASMQLQQGQTLDFGDLHVQPDGIRWKNKAVVPYANLKEIGLKGSQFRIKADGKWLDYASVASQKIPNLFVALELIEEKRTLAQRSAMPATIGTLS